MLFHTFVTQVDLLKNKFGFDDAFNYKEESDLDAALKRLVAVFYFWTEQMLVLVYFSMIIERVASGFSFGCDL